MNYKKTENEFNKFFEKELRGIVESIEDERKRVKSGILKWNVIFVLSAMLAYFYFIFLRSNLLGGMVVAFSVGFIALFRRNKDYGVILNKKMKEKVIYKILLFINPNFYFDAEDHIEKEDFLDSNLHPKDKITNYTGDDLIRGEFDGLSLKFSELLVREKRSTGRSAYYIDIFRGMFFVFDFNKEFNGAALAISKEGILMPSASGVKRANKGLRKFEEVRLENNDFSKKFFVSSTNQVLARYIFTPKLMDKILKFKETLKGDFLISFNNGKLFIGLNTNKEHFHINIQKKFDKEIVFEYFKDINKVFDIAETFDLNNDIWTAD